MKIRFIGAIFLILLVALAGCKEKKAASSVPAIKVEVDSLTEREFSKKIHVQGNIQPLNSVTIAARVSGTIEALKVEEGDLVKKGDIIFQTDRTNLENLVLSAQQSLLVAEENYKMVTEDMVIAEVTLNKAKSDHQRALQLFQANAMSQGDFENAEADFMRGEASFRRAEAILNYTKVKVSQSKTDLLIAEKNLADSIIKAPYDGVITECYLEEGEFAIMGASVLKIEAQDELEVSARISSLYYNGLSLDTKIIIILDNKELCETTLSYISPSVSPLSRTFEIKARLPKQSKLISGTLCDIDIVLAERQGYGIIHNAVIAQAKAENILFVVQDDHVKAVPVETGFSTDGYIEILNGEELKNESIVVSGHYYLNAGSNVEVISESSKNDN